jgi:hypothetical protein
VLVIPDHATSGVNRVGQSPASTIKFVHVPAMNVDQLLAMTMPLVPKTGFVAENAVAVPGITALK